MRRIVTALLLTACGGAPASQPAMTPAPGAAPSWPASTRPPGLPSHARTCLAGPTPRRSCRPTWP